MKFTERQANDIFKVSKKYGVKVKIQINFMQKKVTK